MAANKRKFKTEGCREKIRTTQLINRLQDYAEGKIDARSGEPIKLESGQVKAIEVLLSKTLPALTSADVTTHQEEARTYEEIRAELVGKHGEPYAKLVLNEITPIQYAELILSKDVDSESSNDKKDGMKDGVKDVLHPHSLALNSLDTGTTKQ